MYYYPTGGISDYVFGLVTTIMVVVAIVFLYRFEKNQNYAKYYDKDYLQTLELTELRFLVLCGENVKVIAELIEDKERRSK